MFNIFVLFKLMFWVIKFNILLGLNFKVLEKRMFFCLFIVFKMIEISFILLFLFLNLIIVFFMLLLGSKIFCLYFDFNCLEKGNFLKYFLVNKF